ncbi:Protein bicaudal C-like protein 1 [Aphelenchoides bicaudatus]|nr:Protein bicaudal C-like protein 1 [Aphelenchoides bicaudatus]
MAIERIKQLAGLEDESDFHCRSNFDLRPALLQNAYGLFNLNTVRWIAFHTNTQMQFSPQGTCIVVLGQAAAILQARKNTVRLVEEQFGVQIAEKTKPNNGTTESAFLIRTHEANLYNAYKARRQLLKEEGERGEEQLDDEVEIANEYAFMDNFLKQTKQKGPHSSPLLPSIPQSLIAPLNANDSACDPLFRDGPDSPDPDESPIAHSLLASARSLKMNKGDLWRTPGLERQMNRERLLLKANRATYDPKNQADQTNNQSKQPTDLWSGLGFSNSLPADLLKPRLSRDFWNDDPNVPASVAAGFKQESVDTTQQPSEMTKMPKGLASVREEEEFSDYNQSNSSNLSSPLNRTGNAPLQAFQLLQQTGKKPAFAASANFFETGFGCSDISWDIRTFTDPAMVLAQLGCSEYLAQFQEVETKTDEQNLKDIGVSTLGARKKIFNAIMRLRESALTFGYRI